MPRQQHPVFASSSCASDRKELLPTFLGVAMEMESGAKMLPNPRFPAGARPGGGGSNPGVALGEALEGDPTPARDGLRSLGKAWQAQLLKGFSTRNQPHPQSTGKSSGLHRLESPIPGKEEMLFRAGIRGQSPAAPAQTSPGHPRGCERGRARGGGAGAGTRPSPSGTARNSPDFHM